MELLNAGQDLDPESKKSNSKSKSVNKHGSGTLKPENGSE